LCSSCGHRQADDASLMAGQLPPRLAASAAGAGRVRAAGWSWLDSGSCAVFNPAGYAALCATA
jgi:hypothetical protein